MTARIALFHILHMAAERGGAAVTDRCEGFSLIGAEHMAPLCEELLFVRAEDIGHFEPVFSHRSGGAILRVRSSEPSISSGLFVERTAIIDSSPHFWLNCNWYRSAGLEVESPAFRKALIQKPHVTSNQNTVIVTGASQGIGAGVVQTFLARGYNAVGTSRSATKAKELSASDRLALIDGHIGQFETGR